LTIVNLLRIDDRRLEILLRISVIVRICRRGTLDALGTALEGRRIGGQLFDAATSVAANYRAACKARSHAEFVSKIGIALEESELTAIFTASHKTASERRRSRG